MIRYFFSWRFFVRSLFWMAVGVCLTIAGTSVTDRPGKFMALIVTLSCVHAVTEVVTESEERVR